MTIQIRLLQVDELDIADQLLKAAFNVPYSRADDLLGYLNTQPDGWTVAEINWQMVGLVGFMDYQTYAYVGFMAVDPHFRGQGIARLLMNDLLKKLELKGVKQVVLDASPLGQPLYEKLGFIAFEETLSMQRKKPSPPGATDNRLIRPIEPRDVPALAVWDAPIFGANRSRALQELIARYPQRSFIIHRPDGHIGGYLIAQARRIGPWVAEDEKEAALLLERALVLQYESEPLIYLPAENLAARQLLKAGGFEAIGATRHMGKGLYQPPGDRLRVFAQSGLTIG